MSSRGTSGKHKGDEKVHVAIRCRPMNDSERKNRVRAVVETNMREKEIRVTCSNNQEKTYKFDKTFGPHSKQLDVYKSVVEPHIDEVLAGYNCTVLAYGQTGTGKTFTMEGERSGDEYTWENDPKAGIIPRTLSQLFDRLEKESVEFSVHVSLLEIYNEFIYDLLSPTAEPALRKIYDDSSRKGSVIVADQTEIRVLDKSEVYDILEQGAAKRRTAATMMNEFSSRSHSVFTIIVHSKEFTKNVNVEEELVKIGKLNLVDLAGSENIGRSGAVDQRAREAGNINQSLLTLGRCITALVDHAPHVPYRESRLTRILQDSLGGATKTSIIATISPGLDNLDETLSTLDYASRAKNIQNKPKVNQRMTKRLLIKQYDNEIERLRRELMATREKNGVCMDQKQYDAMTSRLEELESTVQERQKELDNYKELFENITEELRVKSEEFEVLEKEFRQIHQMFLEQSHLAQVKGKHGVKAVKDGRGVVEVAAEVTDSIHKVHDKVDRFKAVDKRNEETLNHHQLSFKDGVTRLNAETNDMIEKSKEHLETCVKSLDARNRRAAKEKKEMQEMVNEIQSTLEHNINDIKNTVSSAINETQSKMKEQDDFLTEKEEMMSTMLSRLQESFTLKMADMHQKCLDTINVFVDMDSFLKTQMENHHQTLSADVNTISNKLDSIVAETKDFQKNQEAGLNSVLEAFKNQMVAVEKQLGLVSAHSSSVCDVALDTRSDVQKLPSLTATAKDEISRESKQVVEKGKMVLHEVEEVFGDTVKLSLENVEKNVAVFTECVTKTENVSVNAMEDLRDAEERIQAVSEDVTDSVSGLATGCQELLAQETERGEKEIAEIQNDLRTTSETQLLIVKAVQSGTKKLNDMTTELCTKKLTTLQPTGETPARKEYSYPKNFKFLPSDDELIKSFHEKMRLEDEVEEKRLEEAARELEEEEQQEQDPDNSDGSSGIYSENSVEENDAPQCGGGMPFFMAGKKQQETKHIQRPATRSRLPMRAMNNLR